jgi:hypothetical protein
MTMTRRLPRALATGVVLSLTLAGTALAEGQWESFIAGALTGFESRTWTDNNTDATSTSVRFEGCSDNRPGNDGSEHTDIAVFREIPILPDENRGQKRLHCATAATAFWGDVPAANYHFTVKLIHGLASGNQLWVDFVRTRY